MNTTAEPSTDHSPDSGTKKEIATNNNVEEIRNLHAENWNHGRKALENAIRIGKLLSQEKEKCRFGSWGDFLKKHLPFSERTASRYIQVYRKRSAIPKSDTVSDLMLSQVYAQLRKPRQAKTGKLPPVATHQADVTDADQVPEHEASDVDQFAWREDDEAQSGPENEIIFIDNAIIIEPLGPVVGTSAETESSTSPALNTGTAAEDEEMSGLDADDAVNEVCHESIPDEGELDAGPGVEQLATPQVGPVDEKPAPLVSTSITAAPTLPPEAPEDRFTRRANAADEAASSPEKDDIILPISVEPLGPITQSLAEPAPLVAAPITAIQMAVPFVAAGVGEKLAITTDTVPLNPASAPDDEAVVFHLEDGNDLAADVLTEGWITPDAVIRMLRLIKSTSASGTLEEKAGCALSQRILIGLANVLNREVGMLPSYVPLYRANDAVCVLGNYVGSRKELSRSQSSAATTLPAAKL